MLVLGGLAVSALAEAATGTSFVFRMQGDRSIVEVVQRFAPQKSLDEVKRILGDQSLLPDISDLVSRVRTEPQSDGSELVFATATKTAAGFEKSVTTVNRCVEAGDRSSWTRSCAIEPARGDTGKFLKAGKTVTRCEEGAQVICTTRADVRPKPINYWPVYVRNPQQLGAAGAGETLRTLGTQLILVNSSLPVQQAKRQYESSALIRMAERLYNDAKPLADSGELGKKALVIQGSDISGSYSKRIE